MLCSFAWHLAAILLMQEQGKAAAFDAQSLLLCLAILAGLTAPALVGWAAPFWLDESYTGVIASQPTFGQFIDWCLHELSGPVYYLIAWVWAKIAGLDNGALRLPSYVFLFGTAAIILLSGINDRKFRMTSAALAVTWMPGFFFATQARPQALLFLLATVQAILFLKAFSAPSRKTYSCWSVVTALMLLTHIYTAIFSGLLFIVLVWRARDEWRTYWVTALPFAAVLAWMVFHLPFMLNFAQPENSWYPVLGLTDLPRIAYDLFGHPVIALLFVAIVGAASIGKTHSLRRSPEAIILLLALSAITVIVITGTIRPFYTGRYLVPCIPAVFLGAAYIVTRSNMLRGWLPVLLVWPGLYFYALQARSYYPAEAQKTLYPLEFESGSEWLIRQGSKRVVFAWDNQTAAINSDARLAEVGGFFFMRADTAAEVFVARAKNGEDWSRVLDEQSRAEDADILWVGGTNHPARLTDNAAYQCKRFGDPEFSQSIACIRKRQVASQ